MSRKKEAWDIKTCTAALLLLAALVWLVVIAEYCYISWLAPKKLSALPGVEAKFVIRSDVSQYTTAPVEPGVYALRTEAEEPHRQYLLPVTDHFTVCTRKKYGTGCIKVHEGGRVTDFPED
jgi:hypothetical protein